MVSASFPGTQEEGDLGEGRVTGKIGLIILLVLMPDRRIQARHKNYTKSNSKIS
jgi:hypothetical protein